MKLVELYGKEIKRPFRTEIGEWMSCSIGVGSNRFLAKQAASLHKPDGLDVIDHTNVLEMYRHLSLLDLSGINTRYQARLNAYGIFTPMKGSVNLSCTGSCSQNFSSQTGGA